GIIVRRAPPVCGIASLLTNVVGYGFLKLQVPSLQFINRMAVCFGLCVAVMTLLTLWKPLPKPVEFRGSTGIGLTTSRTAVFAGLIVVVATLALYVVFSPLVAART